MPLKALVQLFAEKFLVSKKESVQDWTYPNIANRIAIQFSSTEECKKAIQHCKNETFEDTRLTAELLSQLMISNEDTVIVLSLYFMSRIPII